MATQQFCNINILFHFFLSRCLFEAFNKGKYSNSWVILWKHRERRKVTLNGSVEKKDYSGLEINQGTLCTENVLQGSPFTPN